MLLNVKNNLIFVFATAFAMLSCNPETEKNNTEKEKQKIDSISKVVQKIKVDSLKKLNPLLIMPPDSNYTGDYVDKYKDGITKFRGQFRFGKRHGQWMSFYNNGLAWSEMHYNKGLRDGVNKVYYENGKMRYQGFYKNDMRDSVWLFFDSAGKAQQTIIYKLDKVISNK